MADTPAPFVRPDVAAFLALLASQPAPSFAEMGPQAAREGMRQMGALFDLPAGEIARDELIEGGPAPIRLFDAQASRAASPLVVFFHGGGFVLGETAGYTSVCGEISRQLGLPVASVDYRLAPENPWPAAPDDCEAAARWLAGEASLGFPVGSLILMGDSAGGGLTIVTAMALRDRPAAVPVIAQCPLYPVTDLREEHPSYAAFSEGYLLGRADMRWFIDRYGADRAHWRASPLAGDARGLPPAVVATASLDPLRDEGRAYAAALVAAGVPTLFHEADGMVHGFLSLRQAMPSGVADVAHCMALLRTLIARA